MLLLLILLLLLLYVENKKLRIVLIIAISFSFIHAFYVYLDKGVLFQEPELIDVTLTTIPYGEIIAWTLKPLEIYNCAICDDIVYSTRKTADEFGKFTISIVKKSWDAVAPNLRIVRYRTIKPGSVLSFNDDAPAPSEHFEETQILGNVINESLTLDNDTYEQNDDGDFKDFFNSNNN